MAFNSESRTSASESVAFELDELFALAQLDIEKGNITEALWKLKQVTSGQTAPIGAFSVCGQLYAQLRLWDRACSMFQKHLAQYPEAVGETIQLAITYSNIGRLPEAAAIWEGLLKQSPAYPPALFYRAAMRAQQGQLAAAKNDLEMLINSAPADDPFFKPGKELLQNLQAQLRTSGAAAMAAPAPGEKFAMLPQNAYKTEPRQ